MQIEDRLWVTPPEPGTDYTFSCGFLRRIEDQEGRMCIVAFAPDGREMVRVTYHEDPPEGMERAFACTALMGYLDRRVHGGEMKGPTAPG